MSLEKLEAKIDHQAGSIGELKEVIVSLNESMVTFVGFQARAEERSIADREWQKRVEKHQDKQDEHIEAAQKTANDAKSQALSNGKWINIGVAILTACIIYVAKAVLDGIGV